MALTPLPHGSSPVLGQDAFGELIGGRADFEQTSSGAPTVRLAERDPAHPLAGPIEVSSEFLGSLATSARDPFIARLKASGGSFLIAKSDSEWTRGLDSVRSLLDRQWTVVFEPSSPAVQSSEVRIQVHDRARP